MAALTVPLMNQILLLSFVTATRMPPRLRPARAPFTDFSCYGLSIFAIFHGLHWIVTVPPTVKIATRTFGCERGPVLAMSSRAASQVARA